jgi:hypothetical protein
MGSPLLRMAALSLLIGLALPVAVRAAEAPAVTIRGDAGSPRAAVWEASHYRLEADVKVKRDGRRLTMYFLSLPEMYAWLRHAHGEDGYELRGVKVQDDGGWTRHVALIDGEAATYIYLAPTPDTSELPVVKAYSLKRHARNAEERYQDYRKYSWDALLTVLDEWYERDHARFEYVDVESALADKDRGSSAPAPGGGRKSR